MKRLLVVLVALIATPSFAQDDWIAESNRHAQILLDVNARYFPEAASAAGVEGHDEAIFDLKPRFAERQEADLEAAAKQLEGIRASASDGRVQQDLDILIDAANDRRTSSQVNRGAMLPFFDL